VSYRGVDEDQGAPGNTCAGQTYTHGNTSYTVPPFGTRIFAQGPDTGPAGVGPSGLPEGCVATASITSDGAELVATVVEYEDAGARMAAYPALPANGTTRHLQLMRHADESRTTVVEVMNASDDTLAVDLTFTYLHDGTTKTYDQTVNVIQPKGAWRFNPATDAGGSIPAGVNGTVRLRARKPAGSPQILAVAREAGDGATGDIAM
jgi:hypothetical protein